MSWFDLQFHHSLSIPFAFDAMGGLRDVGDVSRGLACGCFCPDCKGPLVAKKGEIVRHHFAHHDQRECRHALEASLFSMAAELLCAPHARLRLPGLGDRCEWIRESNLYDEDPAVGKFLQKQWVLDPEEISLPEGFELLAPNVLESSWHQPDLVAPEEKLAVHFLSHRKPYARVAELKIDNGWRTLGLNLSFYVGLWWETCDEDRTIKVDEALSARETMSDWLGEQSSGRGFLFHSEENVRRRKFNDWAEKLHVKIQADRVKTRRVEEIRLRELTKRWTVPSLGEEQTGGLYFRHLKPDTEIFISTVLAWELGLAFWRKIDGWIWVGRAGTLVPPSIRKNIDATRSWGELSDSAWAEIVHAGEKPELSQELSLGQDGPDQVLETGIGVCRMCGGRIDRMIEGRGLFRGRQVEKCSTNPKHPLKIVK